MRDLPVIVARVASFGRDPELRTNTGYARYLSGTARNLGYENKLVTISDATVDQIRKGRRDDDPRILAASLEAATAGGLLPLPEEMLNALVEADRITITATSRVGDGISKQEQWVRPLLAVLRLTSKLRDIYSRTAAQIDDTFPEFIAGGPSKSFAGQVFKGGTYYVLASIDHCCHDAYDGVRWHLKERGLAPIQPIQDWLDEMGDEIGLCAGRVRILEEAAQNYLRAATALDEAARLNGDQGHGIFCSFLAARARGNAQALLGEFGDIVERTRSYGGFQAPSIQLADELLKEHKKRQAHLPMGMRQRKLVADALEITRLRPFDFRPTRAAIYNAIRDQQIDAIRELLPAFAVAMQVELGESFKARPPTPSKKLPLVEEPGLQQVFRSNADIAKLAGWTPVSKVSKAEAAEASRPSVLMLQTLASLVVLTSVIFGGSILNINPADPTASGSIIERPVVLADRPGPDRLGDPSLQTV